MRVIQIYRKRDPRFFSIERVFKLINNNIQGDFELQTANLPESGLSLANLAFLFKLRLSDKSAIFHVTGDCYYATWMLPSSRVIVTYHDCGFVSSGSRFKRALLKFLYVKWPVHHTAYITAISEKSKYELIGLTSCEPDSIRVINNPVSDLIRFVNKEFCKENPILLFIGITPNKNLERVLVALEGIRCTLLVIGKLDEAQIQAIGKSGVAFRNEFGLTDEQMADRYAEADIVLFPSLYEGFGLPILEGFKAGRAVLTSNLNPMKEIAEDAASLVDPTDVTSIRNGLLEIIENRSYRESLINRGFDIVRKYEGRIVSRQYFNFYKEVYSKVCAD